MRVFFLCTPSDYGFAQAHRKGTWTDGHVCPECLADTSERVPPLIIEWDPGSDQIGDFTWPGLDDEIVVTDRVRRALEPRFPSTFRPVEMWQNPRLRRPTRVTKRTKPRVWLPHRGPRLWELEPIGLARLDRGRSNWRLLKKCGTCGREFWDGPEGRRRTALNRATWTRHGIFRIAETGRGGILCTETVKEFIESHEFTNVSFNEEGQLPD